MKTKAVEQSHFFPVYEYVYAEDGKFLTVVGWNVYAQCLGTAEYAQGTVTTTESYTHPHLFRLEEEAEAFAERVKTKGEIQTELWNHTKTEVHGETPYWGTWEYAARERFEEVGY